MNKPFRKPFLPETHSRLEIIEAAMLTTIIWIALTLLLYTAWVWVTA